MEKITREDPRYTDSTDPTAKFRAWINASDMGGWSGDNAEDFREAIEDELRYAAADEHIPAALDALEILEISIS